MSEPGEEDLRRLKRLLRYFKGTARRTITFPWDQPEHEVEVEVDSDFAGCMVTRRSTCGGVIKWRGGMIRAWSKTMPTLALSTGEAELGAAARGAAESIGIKSLFMDFGIEVETIMRSDASAAIGICHRLGLGKVRHLSVADLWIQQRVRSGELKIEKLCGEKNTSDLLTKALDRPRIDKLSHAIGIALPENYKDEVGEVSNDRPAA